MTVNRFMELMRHLSKLFMITEKEIIVIKMNLFLLEREFQGFENIILLDQYLAEFIKIDLY